MTAAKVADVFAYFADVQTVDGKRKSANGYTLSQFNADWKLLGEKDRADLKNGIGDGTLNY